MGYRIWALNSDKAAAIRIAYPLYSIFQLLSIRKTKFLYV